MASKRRKAPEQRRVLWTKFRDGCRGEWSIFLVNFIEHKDDCRGITYPDDRTILIKYSQDHTLMCRTFIHEVMHAAAKDNKIDVNDDDPVRNMLFYGEEAFVTGAEVRMHAILCDLGFRFPEIPNEAASLLAA